MSEPGGVRVGSGRPPWWLVAVVALVIAVATAGNFLAGWRNREEVIPTTVPAPTLDVLLRRSEAVVLGEAVRLERLGRLADPAVVATIRVDDALRGGAGEVTVYDTGFKVGWRTGERLLLFLDADGGEPGGVPAAATHTVLARYGVAGDRVDAPFTLADVRRSLGRPATAAAADPPAGP